ncbi:hypothetical protein GIB67_030905 [Kingdonia uniflora]|uniref:Pentatricopeptide repeat-containing protein n=1 Tax=Kingdonia uniflora TaxID=39325 RepID=A0A7J7L3D5_9MAGN|nr:hypothetical protein GIB67_030905 [Kingdonia uniflora]
MENFRYFGALWILIMMNTAVLFGRRVYRYLHSFRLISKSICSGRVKNDEFMKESVEKSNFDTYFSWNTNVEEPLSGLSHIGSDNDEKECFSTRRRFFDDARCNAERVIEILRQDGPGFDAKLCLDEMQVRVSNQLVREVLINFLEKLDRTNKTRCAKLGYKFFVWSSCQKNYRHTVNTYHLIMEIFAQAEEFKAMWRLLDEMTENGYFVTARTFNILICTCGEVGLARDLVERFIKSKKFNFRPYKHSFNAILHSLLGLKQYRLIEWVHQKMLLEGYSPDVLTYNILMYTKYRLGNLDQFHKLLDEMCRDGLSPDLHTYNVLLHVLGEGDKPLAALNLMNHMREVGCIPSVLHFTSLIYGLSRAGNLEACKYFFDEMANKGSHPDVVCYTVMITGYVVAGDLEKAHTLFDDMIIKGYLPNVYTYNSMILGLCYARKFEEALSMLKKMESVGCNPNFFVYNTLVRNLCNAGKLAAAHEIIRQMVEKGQYVHLLSRFKRYKRC